MPTKEGTQTFDEWWAGLNRFERPFGTAAEIIAKKAWNAGISSACEIFGYNEGVDFGAEKTLHVEVPK